MLFCSWRFLSSWAQQEDRSKGSRRNARIQLNPFCRWFHLQKITRKMKRQRQFSLSNDEFTLLICRSSWHWMIMKPWMWPPTSYLFLLSLWASTCFCHRDAGWNVMCPSNKYLFPLQDIAGHLWAFSIPLWCKTVAHSMLWSATTHVPSCTCTDLTFCIVFVFLDTFPGIKICSLSVCTHASTQALRKVSLSLKLYKC